MNGEKVSQKKSIYGVIELGVLVVNALQLIHSSSAAAVTGEFTRYAQAPVNHRPTRKATRLVGTGCVPSPGGQKRPPRPPRQRSARVAAPHWRRKAAS
jgi:hypothetical protein